jgi:hypothetical protein
VNKFLFILIITITGCATSPKELMRTKPVIEYETSKAPLEVKDCILEGWLENISNVNSYETSKEYGITYTDTFHQTTVAAVKISKTRPAKVQYYHGRISMSRWEDPVKKCQ